MHGNLYGWKYWLGGIVVVLVMLGFGFALNQLSSGFWRGDAQLILGLLMWPPLIIYHVMWTRQMRRKSRAKAPASKE
jgi:hypothetical protein